MGNNSDIREENKFKESNSREGTKGKALLPPILVNVELDATSRNIFTSYPYNN